MKESFVIQLYNRIDSALKFPNLRNGETGIQVGFDLSSKNLTTDVIRMHHRVKNQGLVIAIAPDPFNHNQIKPIIQSNHLNILLVQKGTSSRQERGKLMLGRRVAFNKMESIDPTLTQDYVGKKIEVELDTLDNIV